MMPLILAEGSPLEHVLDNPIWAPGGVYVISNHIIMMLVAAALMLLIFPRITKPYRDGKHVPTGTRNFFEAIMVYVRNDVAKPVLGHETDRFMPFLWTLFFFILFNNVLGLIPLDAVQNLFLTPSGESHGNEGHGHGGHHGFHPIYGTATANIAVTGALAVFCFVFWNLNGIKALGFKNYAHHFLGGAPWYMAPVMVPVELLGTIVKPTALAIRLMANMTAGHVLLAVLTGSLTLKAFSLGEGAGWGISTIIVIGSVGIMLLELFVAFLQAYLFTFLVTLFLGQLVVHEHDEHHDEVTGTDEAHEAIGGGNLTDYAKLPEAAREASPA